MHNDNQTANTGPTNLAPVYLDNKPISLKDPKPKVSAILSASGKPETTDVKWLQFQPNTKSLRSEEVLDRTTDPTKPIYLTSTPKGGATQGWQGKDAAKDLKPAGAAGLGGAAKSGAPAQKGATAEKAFGAMGQDDDVGSEGMQDDADAEVGGESGRTATTDE